MRLFRNVSIKRKQTLMVMIASGGALLLACLAFTSYEVVAFRRAMIANLSMLTETLASASTAALDFNDPKSAQETLAALRAEPQVTRAAIYDRAGNLFATYHRTNVTLPFSPARAQTAGFLFKNDAIECFRPIASRGEPIGTVFAEADSGALIARLRQYALIAAGVFSVSTLVALALSAWLQKIVSAPILNLVETARCVAREQNFSRRAVCYGQDELGILANSFNAMLAQIEHRDAQLSKARELLEIRVEERTAELQQRTEELHEEVLQHRRTETALGISERLMVSLVETLPHSIIRKDLAGRFSFVNGVFCRAIGKSREEILGKTDFDLFPRDLAAKFRRDDEQVLARGQVFETEEENRNAQGERIFVQAIKTPLYDSEQNPVGIQVVYWDVTSRKQAEAKLDAIHKQLLESSRMAGMAEVATSVLHNVGNVLNSINVTSTLLDEHVRKSRASGLTRLVALLEQHAHNIADFLAHDPKGRKVPEFLKRLAEHLNSEHAFMLNELDSLRKNVGHVKDIVAMQQSYAKISGVVETVQLTDLVEDTLRMNATSFARQDVKVVRQYEPVPPLSTDKHKVLQILINLVRNARYACEEGGEGDKQVVVRVERAAEHVRLAVSDNGIGIAPENLTRIFSHGFTTRKQGHGFGLHSGALAAKELGGLLTVHSDGPGKGATFTLELPLPKPGISGPQASPG
jgi:PAS domain S-box-containing protein